MPMIEVVYARDESLDLEKKKSFAKEAEQILQEVLGTPPGRMRLAFYHLLPEDSLGLLEQSKTKE